MGKIKSKLIPGILLLAISLSMFAVPVRAEAQTGERFCYDPELKETNIRQYNSDTTGAACKNAGFRWVTDAERDEIIAAKNAERQAGPQPTRCWKKTESGFYPEVTNKADCDTKNGFWGTSAENTADARNQSGQSGLYGQLGTCGLGIFSSSSLIGCVQVIIYLLFVTIPSFLMSVAAYIFNFMAAMTLSPDIYKLDFIEKIWRIVRDFANIFFILILLYAAFQIMLDLGHGGGKKIIASVILIALLVNFSLFFTKIVIDSSNIVGLIFFNRIKVSANDNYRPVARDDASVKDKNTAGALISRFKIGTFFNDDTIDELRKALQNDTEAQVGVPRGSGAKLGELSPYFVIGIMVAYGLVAFALAYSFLVVGLVFLGRLINLIMLMVISPFAFVSYAVPKFKSIDTIGFDSWLKKLFETAFVAAVFMFILYIISQVLDADIFAGYAENKEGGFFRILLLVFLPAILIVILLLKGTKYAKKASGEFTGAIISGAKVLGGAALGVGLGAAALGGTKLIGGAAQRIANNDELRAKAAAGDKGAQRKLDRANYWAGKSFDLRQTGVGKFAASKAGINVTTAAGALGLGTKKFEGGRKGQHERDEEKTEERRKTYLLTKSGAEKQDEKSRIWKEEYEGTKERAKRKMGESFNEKKFETYYKGGANLDRFGLAGEKGKGREKTAKEVNEDRSRAFGMSLEEKDKHWVKEAFLEFFRGSAKMVGTPKGAAITLAAGALTGGLGAAAVIAGGGFLSGLTSALKKLDTSTRELAASMKRGPDSQKEQMKAWMKYAQKYTAEHGGEKPEKRTPPPPPPPPSPAGGAPA